MSPPLCGGGTTPCAPKPPRGVPIPPRPRQDRRDSGVTAAVWGGDLSVSPQTPTGRPYPSAAQAGPEGLGCNRRCVGEGPLRAPPKPPRGVPIPPRPRQDRRDSGVTAAVWGRDLSVRPKPPRGVRIPPRRRQDQMDSGVTAAVWGRHLSVRPQNPHGASLSLRSPGRTGGTRV